MAKYWEITYKNGATRVMYGTEEQAREYCAAWGATYKEKVYKWGHS